MHEQLQTYLWAFKIEDALAKLKSSRTGLTESEADIRLRHFGHNTLPRGKRFTVLGILTRQFSSPLIFILIIAACLTIFLREWVETVVILFAIGVNAALGFYQEFRAENTLEKLTTYIKERARVLRDDTEEEIDSTLLVPGDIIHLSYGSRVPADARLLESNDLSVDESVLTGESLPVEKSLDVLSEGTILPERANMVFAGTLVVEGSASALVATTGRYTEIGRIAELVSETKREETPLQRALSRLGWFIFAGIAVLVAIIFFLGLARGLEILPMLLIAVAISVGAIPEALPIALTVILAVGVERLAGRKGIMRNLAAAETLGSTTVIMTDKTGTLTEANMRLVDIRTRTELLEAPGAKETLSHLGEHEKEILEAALWGADVVLENPDAAKTEWNFTGKPIEAAIARAAHEAGIDVRAFGRARSSLLTFNSTNKFSISGNHAKEVYVAVGAPDILLARSRLTKDDYLAIESHIHAVSSEGKRLLGVARLPSEKAVHLRSGVAKADHAADLEFMGVLVFRDPIRPEAKAAIEKMEHLGTRVVMLTGDLKGTAIAVAHELGWEVGEGNVLTGDELHRFSDEELIDMLPNVKIFSRVTPEDKLRIGKLYQKRGEVVAMTGDGVNDAPALKAVDIGIALGSGTDVAKSVAGLVLLDDNFKTIVAAIEEGRRILENIRKVFVYLTSTCLDAVILVGGALAFGLPLPLSALQIIWVNFFADSLPALSFAFDKEYEARKNPGSEILTREVRVLSIGVGILTSALLFGLYWTLIHLGIDTNEAQSMIFVCFALYGLIIAYSFRSLTRSIFSMPIFDNTALNASVAFGVILILASMLIPFLRELLGLTPLTPLLIGIVALWLVVNIGLVETTKWGFRKFAS
ncbi:MAG: cation-transporting P-type ATPase [Minisyncoccia bacterium]